MLSAMFQGKSTFLTGFGLGFLAFGLKKLLLPLFFGVQIIKSVLLALFLPSIIGSIGNIVGKGTYFAINKSYYKHIVNISKQFVMIGITIIIFYFFIKEYTTHT